MTTAAEKKNVTEWQEHFIADWRKLWAADTCEQQSGSPEESGCIPACAESRWTEGWKTGFQDGWAEGLLKGRKSEKPNSARMQTARRMLAAGKYRELEIAAATKLTRAQIRSLAEEDAPPDAAPEPAQPEEQENPQAYSAEEAYTAGCAAGYRAGLEEGRKEGVMEARQMMKKFIAIRMLDMHRFSMEEIAAATDLPLSRVEKLYVPKR